MPEWISVKDRLPEKETDVLALRQDRKCFVGYICEPSWNGKINWVIWTAMKSTRNVSRKVTHWMPLPEPPKEDDAHEF